MTVSATDRNHVRSALVERWQATTPLAGTAAAHVVPSQAPDQAETSARAAEEHLAAIVAGAGNAVPAGVLEAFLAPIRAALAIAPAQRDTESLAASIDRLEDLLEAFLMAAQSARGTGPEP